MTRSAILRCGSAFAAIELLVALADVPAAAQKSVVVLDRLQQSRISMTTVTALATMMRPVIPAYGRLVQDPSLSFTLRAPLAGVVRASREHPWPDIGDTLADEALVGDIEPRFSSAELLDFRTRISAAQNDEEQASASLIASRAEYHRLQALYEQRATSQERLQQGEAKMKQDESLLQTAEQRLRLLQSSLAGNEPTTASTPLRVEKGGEITEIAVAPGESVQAGDLILRVSRFESLLARVELLPGDTADVSATTASIIILGREGRPMVGRRLGLLPKPESEVAGLQLVYRIRPGADEFRPGQAARALIPRTSGMVEGVTIPRDAVVRHDGRTYVYVISDHDSGTGAERIIRREVKLELLDDRQWFVSSGLKPGEVVVAKGASLVLSHELLPQFRAATETEAD